MAMVICPGFSFSASGTFANSFYFQHRKGNHFSLNFFSPMKFSHTPKQKFFRKMYGIVIENWRIENQAVKDTFIDGAKLLPLTGFNLYYQYYFSLLVNPHCGNAICGLSRCGVYS